MRRNLIAVVVLCPSFLLADPIYLECQVIASGGRVDFSVKLDEASGKITHTYADGSAFNADGFFAANTISYKQVTTAPDTTLTVTYEIDRTTLNVAQTSALKFYGDAARLMGDGVPSVTARGTCRIAEVSGRKI